MSSLFKSLFGKKDEAAETAGIAAVPAQRGSGGETIHATDESFEELVLNSPVPVMVDFWAPWCGPCRMITPIVEELARQYDGRAVIVKVNTDENLRVASELGIVGIPTVILFKSGQEVDRVVGYAPRHTLEQKLKAALD